MMMTHSFHTRSAFGIQTGGGAALYMYVRVCLLLRAAPTSAQGAQFTPVPRTPTFRSGNDLCVPAPLTGCCSNIFEGWYPYKDEPLSERTLRWETRPTSALSDSQICRVPRVRLSPFGIGRGLPINTLNPLRFILCPPRPYWVNRDPERSEMRDVLLAPDYTKISPWANDITFGWVIAGAVRYLEDALSTQTPSPGGAPPHPKALYVTDCVSQRTATMIKASSWPTAEASKGSLLCVRGASHPLSSGICTWHG